MLSKKCLCVCVLLFVFFSLAECAQLNNNNKNHSDDDDEDEDTDKELNHGQAHCPEEAFEQMCLQGTYMRQRPPNPLRKGGTEVNVTLLINSLTSIDSIENVIGMELSLVLAWRDPRVEWKTFPKNPGASWILLADLMRFGSTSFQFSIRVYMTGTSICRTPTFCVRSLTRPRTQCSKMKHSAWSTLGLRMMRI